MQAPFAASESLPANSDNWIEISDGLESEEDALHLAAFDENNLFKSGSALIGLAVPSESGRRRAGVGAVGTGDLEHEL